MSIKDTRKNPHPEWLMGGNPDAIERQEEQGQKELIESSQLPIKINNSRKDFGDLLDGEFYKKIGITIRSSGDNLFYTVTLPKGWKIKPTDHSMWSELLNDKNEKIASIFYKAAFYDRDAFIHFDIEKIKEIINQKEKE